MIVINIANIQFQMLTYIFLVANYIIFDYNVVFNRILGMLSSISNRLQVR